LASEEGSRTLLPKDSALLACLLSRQGELVTKQELMAQVWPGVAVDDGVIKTSIKRLRKALGDDSKNPTFIATVHRRGYRYIGPVEAKPTEPPSIGTEGEDTGFVGRGEQLARLQQAYAQAESGCGQLVFITGEAGIGKSALVDRFVQSVYSQAQLFIARGHGVDTQGPGEAYGPLFEALESLAGQTCRVGLGDLLRRHAPMWLAQLPSLLEAAEGERLARQLLGTGGERMLRELVMLLCALGREKPLVLVLEDLHWADGATLDALAVLARRLEFARLLVIATYRPAEAGRGPLHRLRLQLAHAARCCEIPLPQLTEEDIDGYLNGRFPGRVRPVALAEWLMRFTEGNPLFLKSLLAHALEQGWLSVDEQLFWKEPAARDISWSVPHTLREVIEERFERLPAGAREPLEQASVVGMAFPTRLLCEEDPQAEIALDELFHGLARGSRFIICDGVTTWPDTRQSPRYAFVHAWYHQVVYDRIPMLHRQQLHRRIGARLEAIFGEFAPRIAAVLAMHFELGRDLVKAITYRRLAGENALLRHGYQEAEAHLTRGLELLEELPEQPRRTHLELALRVALGSSLSMTRGYSAPLVEHTYSRARMLSEREQAATSLLPTFNGLWAYYLVRAQFDVAAELIDKFVDIALREEAESSLAYANFMECLCHFYQGHFSRAKAAAERCLAMSDPDAVQGTMRLYGFESWSGSLAHRGLANWCLGHPEQGLQDVRQALQFAESIDSPFSQATVLAYIGWLHIMCRDVPQAMAYVDRLIGLTDSNGFGYYKFHGAIFQGYLRALAGDPQAGIEQIEGQMALFEKSGAQLLQTLFSSLLIEAHSQAGNIRDGLHLLNAARRAIECNTAHWSKSDFHRIEGDLLCQAAEQDAGASSLYEEAEGCYHRALEVARQQRAKSFELRAALGLSRLWTRRGRRGEARNLLTGIHGWFDEKVETGDLLEARGLLESLR
jgi:predicted ATPase